MKVAAAAVQIIAHRFIVKVNRTSFGQIGAQMKSSSEVALLGKSEVLLSVVAKFKSLPQDITPY